MFRSIKEIFRSTTLFLFFLMATKPVIGNDYTDLTSFTLHENGVPLLSSKFQCKVLETNLSSLSNGRETTRYSKYESWPNLNDTTEIELELVPHTQMFFVKSAFDFYVGQLDAGRGTDFIYIINEEKIQISGDNSWIKPAALQLSMMGGILTFSRYHRNDFNVAYSSATETKRDIFVGHAFMDCRAENFIVEEIFTILKQHPDLQHHKG